MVTLPLLDVKNTLSLDVGTDAPLAPPSDVDQVPVLFQFPDSA